MAEKNEITLLLKAWNNGDKQALDALIPLVQKELYSIAHLRLRKDRLNHTLQATALVNEAYLRLADCNPAELQNRAQFFALASTLMRNILVDYARATRAAKRGGDGFKISLEDVVGLSDQPDLDLIALDDALKALAKVDPQQCKIIELRYFGGLSMEEISQVLGISTATISREWKMAKLWLLKELGY